VNVLDELGYLMSTCKPVLRTVLLATSIWGACEVEAHSSTKCKGSDNLSCYIQLAAAELNSTRADLGWIENGDASFLTRTYPYGNEKFGVISDNEYSKPLRHSSNGWPISCNGAVFETVVLALKYYSEDHPEWTPTKSAPLSAWNKWTITSLRGQVWNVEPDGMPPLNELNGQQWSSAIKKTGKLKARSVPEAFERFGLGDPIKLRDLRPGDIVTFNRDVNKFRKDLTQVGDGSAHSVVFLGWIGSDQKLLDEGVGYAEGVVKGFKYFSAQTNAPSGMDGTSRLGLGYRFAYFKNFCPQDIKNTELRVAGKKNCLDQRIQDRPNYWINKNSKIYNSAKYSATFPLQSSPEKPDCCVVRKDGIEQLTAVRLRLPERWTYVESSKVVVRQCSETFAELGFPVSIKCPSQ
jgi:hypothetical protein